MLFHDLGYQIDGSKVRFPQLKFVLILFSK